jgi:hypothetical protein
MKHFYELLVTLGAIVEPLPLKETSDWAFWKAIYRTPRTDVPASYLYLKSKCPLKEATPPNLKLWQQFAGVDGYEVVVTPSSALAQDQEKTKSTFGGITIKDSKKLLLDNFLKGLSWRSIEKEEYFIDPDLQTSDGKTVNGATRYLMDWMRGSPKIVNRSGLAVLVADGGIGKTTVSRIVSQMLHDQDSLAIPILVESAQWRHLLQSGITMPTVWDLAISRRFDHASRLLANDTALRVLIREGLFVVIFDGFDELCVTPNAIMNPKDVIANLMELVTPEDEEVRARILVTSRRTYWESVKDDIDTSDLETIRLKGFDNEQRKSYFKARLSNQSERDIALRLAKEISGGIYEALDVEDANEDRPSGVPFILDLIARYVQDNPKINVNPYQADPFGNLLTDVCRREKHRHSLDIDANLQMELFEELFREYPDTVLLTELMLYLEYICNVTDEKQLNSFTNHVFLQRVDKDTYSPRYEVLRVYFIARFLADGLAETAGKAPRAKIAKLLALNSTGKTQVFEWLLRQLKQFSPDRLIYAVHHALDIIADRENHEYQRASATALFHLVISLILDIDKQARIQRLATFLKGSISEKSISLNNRTLSGIIRAFDLSYTSFIKCTFVDVEFKNCIFGNQSQFLNCAFEGTLTFTNCDGSQNIVIKDEQCSKEAEHSLAVIRNLGTRDELKQSFAEDALGRSLKKFRGDYGFMSIQYRHHKTGLKLGNPYNEKVWEVLMEQGIVQRHSISNVEEGGLNVTDEKELRREIISYLDNGVFGRRLQSVIQELKK